MRLKLLEEALDRVHKNIKNLNFCEFIRQARMEIGLKQYKAGEYVGITHQRLKNLETGYFRDMPTKNEIAGLSALYGISQEYLIEKAKKHVEAFLLIRKIKVIKKANYEM